MDAADMSESVNPSTAHPTDAAGGFGADDEGGDPACWAARVCPDCGQLATGQAPQTCDRCGAELPG